MGVHVEALQYAGFCGTGATGWEDAVTAMETWPGDKTDEAVCRFGSC